MDHKEKVEAALRMADAITEDLTNGIELELDGKKYTWYPGPADVNQAFKEAIVKGVVEPFWRV